MIEAIVATLLAGIVTAGLVSSFMQAHKTAEWSSYSLAGQGLALQCVEQTRSAKWDPYSHPPVDQLVTSNFPERVEILDVPVSGNNVVYATNRITIRTVSEQPPLKQIEVQCTWTFSNRGTFTNTVMTYRAADQ